MLGGDLNRTCADQQDVVRRARFRLLKSWSVGSGCEPRGQTEKSSRWEYRCTCCSSGSLQKVPTRCSLLAQVCLSDKDLLCFPYPPDSNRAGCCLKSCVRIPFTIVCARKYRKSILEFDATDNSEKGPDRLQGTRARRISPRRTTVRFAAQIQTKSDTVIENSLYSTPLRALAQNSRTLFQATRSHLVST